MPELRHQFTEDVAIVENRRNSPIFVSMAAQYSFASRRDTKGNRREFPCRIVSISLPTMTLFVPVNGQKGERVITHCEDFGRLDGTITRVLDRGFIMKIEAPNEALGKLAGKIEVYEKIKNHDLADRRNNKRIIPKDPRSTIFFGDDNRVECFVIDISTSGAAISAEFKPEIGTPLAIGTLVGRVVRHFADGFAVQFLQLQDIEGLEQRLVQS